MSKYCSVLIFHKHNNISYTLSIFRLGMKVFLLFLVKFFCPGENSVSDLFSCNHTYTVENPLSASINKTPHAKQ